MSSIKSPVSNSTHSNGNRPLNDLSYNEPLGQLEAVAFFYDAMPTEVTVSHKGRTFVNFPKWWDDVKFTVAEIIEGNILAYPNEIINKTNEKDQSSALVSVQSVVVDPVDRLGFLIREVRYSNQLNMWGQSLCV